MDGHYLLVYAPWQNLLLMLHARLKSLRSPAKFLAKFVPAGCPSAPKEIASMGTNPRLSPVEQKFAEKKAEKFLEAAFADCRDLDLGKNCESSCWIPNNAQKTFLPKNLTALPYGP